MYIFCYVGIKMLSLFSLPLMISDLHDKRGELDKKQQLVRQLLSLIIYFLY